MKTALSYFLLVMLTMSLSSFNERSAKPVANHIMGTKYCFHTSSHTGKWSGSRTVIEKVFFITEVVPYTCQTVFDCDKLKDQLRSDFRNELSNYEISGPSAIPEYFTDRNEAETYRSSRIKYYGGLGYKIVEL